MVSKRPAFYIEGALQFLVVKRNGDEVVRRRIVKGTHAFLPIGRYWVSSYTRICDGNCGNLDPPMFRCARYVELRGGDRIHATLSLRVGRRCSIHFERA